MTQRRPAGNDESEYRKVRDAYEALLEAASEVALLAKEDAVAGRDAKIRSLKRELAQTERNLALANRRLNAIRRSRSYRAAQFVTRIVTSLRRRTVRTSRASDPPPVPTGNWRSELSLRPLVFAPVDAPQVSIVVPTYENAELLYRCLRSLAETTGDTPCEVIVVNDAPLDDKTKDLLRQIPGVKVVTNSQNVGFLSSCNKGASLAGGRYIIFLNNDTEVQPGWLTALLDVAEAHPRVGLVGAKLVYPDGRLQEAGGIVWNDANGHNYGRGDSPELPAYNFVREVDYCSGACILVRKELFEQLGGFDERFTPAYYEDTDLAFSIRALGHRIVYQPAAKVVHVEGASHGTDLSGGLKRFQELNRVKFFEKWRTTLERDHHPPGTDLVIARSRSTGPRVLVSDLHVPTYDRDSGSQRMYHLLRILSESGYIVTFVPGDLIAREPWASVLQQMGIEVVYGLKQATPILRSIGPFLSAAILSRPALAASMFGLVRSYAPQAPIFYDSVDLHFVREDRRVALHGNGETSETGAWFRRLELALARLCDASIAITEDERRLLLEEIPDARVYVIPNVHEPRTGSPAFSARRDLIFVGNFRHPPNEDAIRYFLSDLWPEVRHALPGVRFHIVGFDPTGALKDVDLKDVVVAGWVDDLDPYLDRMRVFIAPLRFGAGMKGKIGQSLAAGLPVVTTSIGAEGMHLADGREALVADDAAGIVDRVLRLYRDEDLWTRVAEAGLRHVEQHFAPKVVRQMLEDMLGDVTVGAEHSGLSGEGYLPEQQGRRG